MSVIAHFWQSLPCWLIWDRFQVVTSWAELAQLKSGGILGGLARTPHHSKCLSLLIAYFWQILPCWLIWDKFQVVTSWAKLVQLKSGGDFGVSGSDPPPLKMSVIAYFWQSWPCWLIWDKFQVVTSWAELAQLKSGGILGCLARTPHHLKCLSLLISDKVDHAD